MAYRAPPAPATAVPSAATSNASVLAQSLESAVHPRLAPLMAAYQADPKNPKAIFDMAVLLDGTNEVPRNDALLRSLFRNLVMLRHPAGTSAAAVYARRTHNVGLGVQLLNAGRLDTLSWLSRDVDVANEALVAALMSHAISNADARLACALCRLTPALAHGLHEILDEFAHTADAERNTSASRTATKIAALAGGAASEGESEEARAADLAASALAGSADTEKALLTRWVAIAHPIEELVQEWIAAGVRGAADLIHALSAAAPSDYVPAFVLDKALEHADTKHPPRANMAVLTVASFAKNIFLAAAATNPAANVLLHTAAAIVQSHAKEWGVEAAMQHAVATAEQELNELFSTVRDSAAAATVRRVADALRIPLRKPSWKDCLPSLFGGKKAAAPAVKASA